MYSHDLLALDPSTTRCGLALFREGMLIASGCVTGGYVRSDILARVVHISEACAAWALGQACRPCELIVEWPKIYTRNKSKGDPNDCVPLAGVAGCLAGMLMQTPALTPLDCEMSCTSYLPSEWIGQVPKVETVKGCKDSARAKKIIARLNHAERMVWDTVKYHDAIDAIGIGLHHLGRLDRKRIFPGAT